MSIKKFREQLEAHAAALSLHFGKEVVVEEGISLELEKYILLRNPSTPRSVLDFLRAGYIAGPFFGGYEQRDYRGGHPILAFKQIPGDSSMLLFQSPSRFLAYNYEKKHFVEQTFDRFYPYRTEDNETSLTMTNILPTMTEFYTSGLAAEEDAKDEALKKLAKTIPGDSRDFFNIWSDVPKPVSV